MSEKKTLPLDCITGIFLRLPVKTLMRFKSISKQHLNLIENPNFIKSHLKRSLQSGNHKLRLVLLGAEQINSNIKFSVYSGDLDSLDRDGVNEIYRPTRKIVHVYGSCNGLMCWRNTEDFTLLNMATKELRRIPYDYDHLFRNTGDLIGLMYGFGHDLIDDDYKLVITQVSPETSETFAFVYETKVYSLNSGVWMTCSNSVRPYLIEGDVRGIHVSGALHSLGYRRPASDRDIDRLIVAFDLGTENFREIDLPDGYSHTTLCNSSIPLGVLDGLLCVMEQNSRKKNMDIWLMRHYMVKESWTKLFSIKLDNGLCHVNPLAYSQCGNKILMKSQNNIFWYEPAKQQVEKLNNLPAGSLICIEIFVESLAKPY